MVAVAKKIDGMRLNPFFIRSAVEMYRDLARLSMMCRLNPFFIRSAVEIDIEDAEWFW